MAPRKQSKTRDRAGMSPPAEPPQEHPGTAEPEAALAVGGAASRAGEQNIVREETRIMPAYAVQQTETQNVARPMEGVTVVGEAVRGVTPETAEFLIEVTASGPSAAQSLRDNQLKTTQVTQALAALGVQPADLPTISLNVYNMYSQPLAALPSYGGMPQIGQSGFGLQPEVQFGSYQTRKILRVNVREPARVGEIADAAVRAGAVVVGSFNFKVTDEAAARRAALEAAGRDARSKAEALAGAAGKQLGDAVAISEDIIATNGTYAALRIALPFAFGAGAPAVTGELEYYARVSARYRLQ